MLFSYINNKDVSTATSLARPFAFFFLFFILTVFNYFCLFLSKCNHIIHLTVIMLMSKLFLHYRNNFDMLMTLAPYFTF